MAITYPITLPTGNRRALTFRPYAIVAMSMSPFTLQQQVQAHSGQLWMVHVVLSPMVRATAEAWIAALLSLNGRYGTFHLGDDSATAPRGSALGSPVVDGAGQTGQTLVTTGWTASSAGVLLPGDWIQIGTGATRRIYRVLTTVNADEAGDATIDLWPRLRESPADQAPLVLTNTMGTFRLAENEMAWDVDVARIYGMEFLAAEAI